MPDLPEIRRVTPDELVDFGRFWQAGFHKTVDDELLALRRATEEPGRLLTATDQHGRFVASSGAFTFDLSVPGGGRVGCAGLTIVTVRADHRRRGLLRAMMRQHHDDARERDEPVAGLYASEGQIYGRFGYGVAIPQQTHRIRRSHLADAHGGDATNVRLLTRDEYVAVAPDIHEVVRSTRAGMPSRTAAWWDLKASDEGERRGPPQWFAAVGDRGIMRYRTREGRWPDRVSDARLEVGELLAVDPDAEADLWAHVASVDLVDEITAWRRPIDDPLPWRLPEEARLREQSAMPVYLRLLDVPAALQARSWDVADRLVLEVADHDEPGNHGRWTLDASPAGCQVERTERAPDVTLDVADLASLWLGGVRPATLLAANRLTVAHPDIVGRLGHLFATDRAPWCPLEF